MQKNETGLTVIVQPNTRHSEIKDFREGVLYLKIAAPPVDGKANREIIRYLSDILGIAKSRISLVKGTTGRRKLLSISGLSSEQVADILDKATKA